MIWLLLIGLLAVVATVTTLVLFTRKNKVEPVDHSKTSMDESKLAIAFHFTNPGRVKTIIDFHPDFFMNHYMIGTAVKDLVDTTSPEFECLKPYFQKIMIVENKGLDFGGFFASVDHIPDQYTHVFKIHDKKDLSWLRRLIDPLIHIPEKQLLQPNVVSAKGQIHPFRQELNINIYWTHLICNHLNIPIPKNFAAGTMFVAPADKMRMLKKQLVEKGLFRLNDETTYDPSWVSYYYKHVLEDPDFMEPTMEEAVHQPQQFADKMIALKCPYNNGHHYVLKTGNQFTNKGWSARDSMFEHALERIVGVYCTNR